jgi:hypothetical protein
MAWRGCGAMSGPGFRKATRQDYWPPPLPAGPDHAPGVLAPAPHRLLATVGIIIGCIAIAAMIGALDILAVGPAAVHTPAVVSECEVDASNVENAVQDFQTQLGTWPANVSVLTHEINGSGPWLRTVPSKANYSIFVSPATGDVYVYPPHTSKPSSFAAANDYTTGTPCPSNAQA